MLKGKLNDTQEVINRLNSLLDLKELDSLDSFELAELDALKKELKLTIEECKTFYKSSTDLAEEIEALYQSILKKNSILLNRIMDSENSDEEGESDFDEDEIRNMMFPNEDSDEGYNWTMY